MRSFLSVLIFFFLITLSVFSQGQAIVVSDVERYELPGVSIRAIEVVRGSDLWFAGSNGRIGRIINGKMDMDSIRHENKYPGFRAIAHNGDHAFILSIEDPALLYRLDIEDSKFSPKLVYKEAHKKVFYDAMTFMDSEHGIAMGDPIDGCLSVILTDDGGKSWKKLSCDHLPPSANGEAAFAASNTNLAAMGNKVWMVSGGSKARVWLSSDYGKNWDVVPTPLQQGKNMTGIFSAAFYNEHQGIIMGGNWEHKKDGHRTKALTSDGGESWSLTADGDAPGYISCVQYIPGAQGDELMAVSTEGIFYSSNAGAYWQKISEEGFYSVRFADSNTAWLSGNEKIVKVKLERKDE